MFVSSTLYRKENEGHNAIIVLILLINSVSFRLITLLKLLIYQFKRYNPIYTWKKEEIFISHFAI